MKGISTILATILIVIIVVAIIGLTYTFSVTLFQQAAGGATNQTAATVSQTQKQATLITPVYCSGGTLRFSLRNSGSLPLAAGEVATFFDDTKLTTTSSPPVSPDINTASAAVGGILAVGTTTTFTVTGVSATGHTLKISSPAGVIPTQIVCS